MSSNENLLKNYENEKNQIKLDIEREQENLKSYRNHRDQASAIACKEKIGRLRSNLRNIEDKIATLNRIIENGGVDPYNLVPVNNHIVSNEIDTGTITETYDLDVDIVGTKGTGIDKKDVRIGQNQKIVRTSTIDSGNVVNQSTTVTNNKILSKSKKQISDKNDVVINVKKEDNEKELMDKFLNEYKNSKSLNRSIRSAGISQSQYNFWCKSGRNRISKNTTYFVNELDKLKRTSKPRNEDSFPKQDDFSKQYLDYYKQNDYSKQYDDYFKKLNGQSKSKRNRLSNESNSEKKLMNDFLVAYRRTRSVNEGIKNAGISQSQYYSWCRDGRNYVSRNATDFVNELDKINGKTVKLNPVINNGYRHNKSDKIRGKPKLNPVINSKKEYNEFAKKNIHNAKSKRNVSPSKKSKRINCKPKIHPIINTIDNPNKTSMKNSHNSEYSKIQIEKMEMVIKYMLEGKTRAQAANGASVSVSQVNEWYNDGRNAKNRDVIKFYKRVRDIESYIKNNAQEKRTMGRVLNYLKMGKTYDEAASYVHINPNLICKWRREGLNKENPNSVYFYNNLKKINNKSIKSKQNISTSNFDNVITFDEKQKEKMDAVLTYIKQGNSRSEASKLANVPAITINNWYSQGSNGNSDNTIYFFNQVNLIESKNESEKELEKMNLALNPLRKNKNFKNRNNIDENMIKSRLKDGENNVTQNTSYSYNEYLKIEIEKDLQKMGKFLELQKEGKNVNEACELTGISLSRLNHWIDQGKRGNNIQASYFVEEYDKLKQNKTDGEYIYIHKKYKRPVECPRCHCKIDFGQNFCHNCGHQLIKKEKRNSSILDKIRSLFE